MKRTTPPPLLGQCPCRCMHVYIFKPLYRDTQLVYFALPSVHLQCMEGASSKNVLTNNVMAAITKHKVYG